jgi:hypothetical protein
MAQSPLSISPETAGRHSYDGAILESGVALPAQAGIPTGPTFAVYQLPPARLGPPLKSESPADDATLAAPSAMVAIAHALEAWRRAERDLGEHLEASAERAHLRTQYLALRTRYHDLVAERLRRPDPPMQLQENCLSLAARDLTVFRRN